MEQAFEEKLDRLRSHGALLLESLHGLEKECLRVNEDGIVEKHSDVDMAMILGTGFPPFRGGLLAYANDYGVGKLVDVMKKLEPEHGERFAACESLKAMARDHAHFDV